MIVTYGTTDTKEGTHIDTSKTLLGAKQYATRNNLKTVSKRVGYNVTKIWTKEGNFWVEDGDIDSKVYLYDNEGKSLDRITIVLKHTKEDDIFGTRLKTFECIGSCYTGNSFFNHSYCQRGLFLGKKIKFKDLSKELQNKLTEYFKTF